MKTSKSIAFSGIIAIAMMGLAACPNPMFTRVQQEVARSRVLNTTYSFLRQWGNPNPQYTFNTTLVVKVDTAGYVYATDRSFRINKYNGSGALQVTFGIAGAGFVIQINDMAFDTSGNMFVITSNYQVQKYSVSGSLLLQFGSYGAGNGQFSSPEGIAVDSSGYIYVVDSGNLRIQKFDSSGNYVTQWSGTGTNGTGTAFGYYAHGIAIYSGNLYVVDTPNSVIKEYNASTGDWVATYGSAGALNGQFSSPQGITVDSSGNFYVADAGNSRVQKFNSSFTWAANLTGNPAFTSLDSVGVDPSGNVYTSDGTGNDGRIQKFNSSGTWLATWGGDNRTVAGAVSVPTGLMYSPSGNSYVIDNQNQRIQEFDPNGVYIRSWGSAGAGNGQFAFGSSGTYPLSGACDAAGNVYIPDIGNNRVQQFDANGNFLAVFVSAGTGDGFVEQPTALAFDSSGNLYVVDLSDQRIQVFSPNGYFQRKWTFSGGSGPLGIGVDSAGNVYVSYYITNILVKFDSNGNVLTQWGSLGSGDGQFDVPVGVAVDSSGYIYVADMLNRRIQKFDSSGNLFMQFGIVGMGSGGFGWPVGIAINSTGQIIVSDYMGCLIQEFNPNPPSY